MLERILIAYDGPVGAGRALAKVTGLAERPVMVVWAGGYRGCIRTG
jgi:hypothetical protein